MSVAISLAERGVLPDAVVRAGIRKLLRSRLEAEAGRSSDEQTESLARFAQECRDGPIALETAAANEQHYEAPTRLFEAILGPRMKYSSGLYPSAVRMSGPAASDGLADAEERMIALAAERADLRDGQDILELGCGWGSWALWLAERFRKSRIVAVSNSRTQKEHIDAVARERGFRNLEVVARDVNQFEPSGAFDRVVSVEMFEHIRNIGELMRRIRTWLRPRGSLFVHIFCHRVLAYPFQTDGDSNWMGRHFFTGGMMPSFDWFDHFTDDLIVERRWAVSGLHYANTLEAWLVNLDRRRRELTRLFPQDSARRLQRWRMFLMACAELFAFADGDEWFVGHFRLTPR